jgi:hypothetical protein
MKKMEKNNKLKKENKSTFIHFVCFKYVFDVFARFLQFFGDLVILKHFFEKMDKIFEVQNPVFKYFSSYTQ